MAIVANCTNGRFAEVATAPGDKVYFTDHGWAGETRVVGNYIEPFGQSGAVAAGSGHDSQQRFQNDLQIGNIQYANYQSEQQVIDFLTARGFNNSIWANWFD